MKQRGYSSMIVGLFFTIISFLGLLIRPTVGAITDKYKYRKTAFTLSIAICCPFVNILIFLPGSAVNTEMNYMDVIKSPLFWFFFSTVTLIIISNVVTTVMEDTICVHILGKKLFLILFFR